MSAPPDAFDQLAARLDALEKRVGALEHPDQEIPAVSVALPSSSPVVAWPEPLPQFASLFPVLGGALLGIAGAYVLRAISGASLLPRGAVALMAAVYAGGWLAAASRAAIKRKMTGALYAAVSILILAPMLWEMSIRFGAMRGTTAAAILAVYVAAATVAGFGRGGSAVFSVAFAGAAITAVALSVATHSMVEFTFILLGMVLVCELIETRMKAGGLRLLVALAADVGVWSLLLIYRLEPGNRTDYPAVSAGVVIGASLLLFSLEATAIARRALLRRQPIPAILSIQAMIAFGLALAALEWMMPVSAPAALGLLCLIFSAGCYAAAYGPLRQAGEHRNFRIFSLWAACLFVGGLFVFAPISAASAVLGIAGLGAMVMADRMHSRTLELQGALFLVIAAAESGLLAYAARAFTNPALIAPGGAALAVAACAIVAYAAADEKTGEEWRKQALHLIPALLAAGAIAALLVLAMIALVKLFLVPDVFHLALVRTVALCCIAVGCAFAGARAGRPQMIRVAYAAVALGAAKLLFEDLRHGQMEFIAGSIFAVALTLIAVPRLAKRGTANWVQAPDKRAPGDPRI
jgi:hypothetical protein